MTKYIALLVFVIALAHGSLAFAEDPSNPKDEYAKAGWANLLHTLVRLKSIDLQDPLLLDEYTILSQCDLYKNFYSDDFKWNKVRLAVADEAKKNVDTFPIAYYFDTKLQLDRYDFQKGLYRFSSKATLNNINTVVLYEVNGPACGNVEIKHLPKTFRVVFDAVINVPGLPLSADDAEALLKHMTANNNANRVVYTRMKFKVVYIEPIIKSVQASAASPVAYSQGGRGDHREMRLDTRLDAVDFYEDAAMTKLIYQYKR